mmetsp:Transcript_22960/g.52581  ORF Transcript_22960/g.52581 Transcript_22960/m.52581 type:complete len:171 (+) Transcript_22960:1542-2054(+)
MMVSKRILSQFLPPVPGAKKTHRSSSGRHPHHPHKSKIPMHTDARASTRSDRSGRSEKSRKREKTSSFVQEAQKGRSLGRSDSSDIGINDVYDVFAPPGKLGVVIDTPGEGAPAVHSIKEFSPLIGQIEVGDKLISVDDTDVRQMTAIKVSKIISKKSENRSRKLTFVRT